MTSRLPCTSQHALKPINTHRLRLCTPFRATKANSLSGRASLRRHHQSPAAKLARPVSAPANAPVRLPASPPRQVSLLQPNTPIPEQDPHSNGRGKRVVVVGGGWAGKTPASCTTTAILRICMPAVHSSLLPMQTLHSASHTQMYRMFTVLSSLPAIHAKPKQQLDALHAGFGAAKHLSSQGYSVTLVDAAPNPGGLSAGWRTDQGRAVEAGVKGFWYQVPSLNLHNSCACAMYQQTFVCSQSSQWTTTVCFNCQTSRMQP